MKNKIVAMLAMSGLVMTLHAGVVTTDKEKTLIGEGACAKCILKETKECQLTVTVEESGKPVTYYLEENKVAKQFGNQLCKEKKKLKVTGTVKTVDGKRLLVPTKIELAKD